MPRNPHKTPCSIPGCRAWAIRDPSPDGRDPPRCSAHRHTGGGPDPGATGNPPTLRVGAPPGNQNHLIHGFYSQALSAAEREDVAAFDALSSLDAEIAITRVALRRILVMLLTGLTPGADPQPLDALDYARYAELAFRGASTVGRLLRARHALGGVQADAFHQSLQEALAEISEELGIELL